MSKQQKQIKYSKKQKDLKSIIARFYMNFSKYSVSQDQSSYIVMRNQMKSTKRQAKAKKVERKNNNKGQGQNGYFFESENDLNSMNQIKEQLVQNSLNFKKLLIGYNACNFYKQEKQQWRHAKICKKSKDKKEYQKINADFADLISAFLFKKQKINRQLKWEFTQERSRKRSEQIKHLIRQISNNLNTMEHEQYLNVLKSNSLNQLVKMLTILPFNNIKLAVKQQFIQDQKAEVKIQEGENYGERDQNKSFQKYQNEDYEKSVQNYESEDEDKSFSKQVQNQVQQRLLQRSSQQEELNNQKKQTNRNKEIESLEQQKQLQIELQVQKNNKESEEIQLQIFKDSNKLEKYKNGKFLQQQLLRKKQADKSYHSSHYQQTKNKKSLMKLFKMHIIIISIQDIVRHLTSIYLSTKAKSSSVALKQVFQTFQAKIHLKLSSLKFIKRDSDNNTLTYFTKKIFINSINNPQLRQIWTKYLLVLDQQCFKFFQFNKLTLEVQFYQNQIKILPFQNQKQNFKSENDHENLKILKYCSKWTELPDFRIIKSLKNSIQAFKQALQQQYQEDKQVNTIFNLSQFFNLQSQIFLNNPEMTNELVIQSNRMKLLRKLANKNKIKINQLTKQKVRSASMKKMRELLELLILNILKNLDSMEQYDIFKPIFSQQKLIELINQITSKIFLQLPDSKGSKYLINPIMRLLKMNIIIISVKQIYQILKKILFATSIKGNQSQITFLFQDLVLILTKIRELITFFQQCSVKHIEFTYKKFQYSLRNANLKQIWCKSRLFLQQQFFRLINLYKIPIRITEKDQQIFFQKQSILQLDLCTRQFLLKWIKMPQSNLVQINQKNQCVNINQKVKYQDKIEKQRYQTAKVEFKMTRQDIFNVENQSEIMFRSELKSKQASICELINTHKKIFLSYLIQKFQGQNLKERRQQMTQIVSQIEKNVNNDAVFEVRNIIEFKELRDFIQNLTKPIIRNNQNKALSQFSLIKLFEMEIILIITKDTYENINLMKYLTQEMQQSNKNILSQNIDKPKIIEEVKSIQAEIRKNSKLIQIVHQKMKSENKLAYTKLVKIIKQDLNNINISVVLKSRLIMQKEFKANLQLNKFFVQYQNQ